MRRMALARTVARLDTVGFAQFAEAKEQVAEEDKAIEEAVAKKPFKEKMLMKMTGLPIIGPSMSHCPCGHAYIRACMRASR